LEGVQQYAGSKHNYSMIILFATTDDRIPCPFCKAVKQSYEEVAYAFKQSLGSEGFNSKQFLEHPVFFAHCDLMKCRDIAVQAGWREIPTIVYVPQRDTKGEGLEMINLDGVTMDYSAETIANFVRERSGYPLKVDPSILGSILYYMALLGVLFVILRGGYPWIKTQYKRPLFWYALSMGTFAFTMAGTVFNSINKPPLFYVHPQNGQTFYIYPSARQQFVYEGFIMAVLLTFCGLSIAAFGAIVPRMKGVGKQRATFAFSLIAFYFSYISIIKIFKMKYQYYPF